MSDYADSTLMPPHDLQAEMGVLGSMLLSESASELCVATLSATDFYRIAHQCIFAALQAMTLESLPPDLILLRDRLAADGTLEKCGGRDYLVSLMEAPHTSANVEHYMSIVQEKAAARSILDACTEAARDASGPAVDLSAVSARIQAALAGMSRPKVSIPTIKDHLAAAEKRMEDRAAGRLGLMTGLPMLDSKMGGFEPGEFVVLAADTSVGKTAFACNMLLNVCAHQRRKALFFSAEVIGPTLAIDLCRILVGFDFWHIESGKLTPTGFAKWREARARLTNVGLWVDDTSGICIEDLVSRGIALAAREEIALIVVDYAQLLRTRRRVESETLRLKFISNELKRLAGETRVPVVVLSQVTPGGDTRRTRYSPEIGHDADVLIFLERTDKEYDRYPEDEPNICDRKVVIAKGRHKGTGFFFVEFDKPLLTFRRRDSDDGERRDVASAGEASPATGRADWAPRTQAQLEPAGAGEGVGGDDGYDVPDGEIPF